MPAAAAVLVVVLEKRGGAALAGAQEGACAQQVGRNEVGWVGQGRVLLCGGAQLRLAVQREQSRASALELTLVAAGLRAVLAHALEAAAGVLALLAAGAVAVAAAALQQAVEGGGRTWVGG